MTRPVDTTTTHPWKNETSPLAVLKKANVEEIIRLAEPEDLDSEKPTIVSGSDITQEDLQAHTERKHRIMQAIDKLGAQGKAELNAVMLYGRGDGEDFPLLVEHSKHVTSDYIAGKAPLAKYLTDGLAKLGL